MNRNALLVEQGQIVPAFLPVGLHTANNDGDWVSLKNFGRCTVVFTAGAGTAGDDPVFTLRQATSVAGTGAKPLPFTRIDIKAGADLATIGSFTTVTQAASNTYTDLTHAEVQKVYVVEVTPDMMDADNGFDCLQLQIPDTGTSAQLGCGHYILHDARIGGSVAPSAIID